MSKFKAFLKKKDIVISLKRYGIDALGAMAQGLFCSLLIGTIINTLGTQFGISFLTRTVATVAGAEYTVGGLATAMSGPAMAVAIGYALHCPPLVLFSLITVGFASNALGGAGGPLAVLFVAIIASEVGKAISKETKVDILVTPLVTIGVGPLSQVERSAALQRGLIAARAAQAKGLIHSAALFLQGEVLTASGPALENPFHFPASDMLEPAGDSALRRIGAVGGDHALVPSRSEYCLG